MLRLPNLGLAAVLAAAVTVSATAQSRFDAVYDVAMFETVVVGDVEVSPINIVEDSRCIDERICFRADELIVTAVLHQFDGLREIELRLGYATPVPGGDLVLVSAGTPPVARGAIPLKDYSFDIEFVPLP